jgi:predicted tellurium resistance membrane protein TerC
MIAAVGVMLLFAGSVSGFVERHPTMKILALSFLLLIGVMLVAEGLGQHVSKAYIYFAMGFALLVEVINLRVRRTQSQPVNLHNRFEPSKLRE